MKIRGFCQMWTDEFETKASSEGWSLFTTDGVRFEIGRVDEAGVFRNDKLAVAFAYQAALRHEPHAMAAFKISLMCLKKEG